MTSLDYSQCLDYLRSTMSILLCHIHATAAATTISPAVVDNPCVCEFFGVRTVDVIPKQ